MKRIIFAAIALFCAFSLNAQAGSEKVRTITVDEAVILAADNNNSLKQKRIDLEIQERKNKTSWNSVSPSASLSGSFNKPLDGLVTDMEAKQKYTYQMGASVSLSLTPSLYTSIRAASLQYESDKTAYEDEVRKIELKVRKDFYTILFKKESMNLARRNMETARIRYENNRDKYNRGQLSELDLLQSQYSYESLRPTIESNEIEYQNYIASFKQTLGLSQEEKIELSGSLSDALPPESFSIDQTIDELPLIQKIKASIEQVENNLMAARFSAYGPVVTANYSWGLGGNDSIEEFKQHQENHSLSLSLRIPLDGYLPWSNGANSIASQKSSLQKLKLQLEDNRTSAQLNLQNSIKNILQKQSQMDLIDRNVELAQKTYDMTLTAYNHGSRDLLTLQSTADALLKAKTDRESKKFELISAVLDLENTLGLPFGTLGKEDK